MHRRRKAMMLLGAMTLPLLLTATSESAASAAQQSRTGPPVALITGSGSTWAQIAVNSWITSENNAGVQVSFTGDGSAAGRTEFANGTVDFAVSDIGYQGFDSVTGTDDVSHRKYAYLPITAGGTAFPYNIVVNGNRITNLRLSGLTLAKIFTNQITNWNDPAITKDNNNHQVAKNLPIITVVPSEGSGTSAQFTRYLNKLYPKEWVPFDGGHPGLTEYWPRQGNSQVALNGSEQVMNYITSPANNGAIGFDEYAYALQNSFPVAQLENAAHYFVLPSQYNDAVALTRAVINYNPKSSDYLLENLDNVYSNPDRRAYPLSSYSYTIMPTAANDKTMDKTGNPASPAKAQALAEFLDYSICQGQGSIGNLGYSALPVNLVEAGFKQIQKIKVAAPKVSLKSLNITTCNNPTFVQGHPNDNYLAQHAPYPPSCDKAGQGPCTGILNANANGGKGSSSGKGSGTGKGTGSTSNPSSSASASASSSASSGSNTGAGGSVGTGTSDTGSSGTSPDGTASNVAADLPPGQSNGLNNWALGALVVLLLLAILIVPPLVARGMSGRGRQW